MVTALLGHPLVVETSASVLGMLAVQTVLAVLLFGLVGAAYYRRRSLPYLLVWVGVSTLLAESLFTVVALTVPFTPLIHVFVDSLLDITLVLAVLAAVYSARQLKHPEPDHDRA